MVHTALLLVCGNERVIVPKLSIKTGLTLSCNILAITLNQIFSLAQAHTHVWASTHTHTHTHTQILATLSNECILSWHKIVFNAKKCLFQQGKPKKKKENNSTVSPEELYTVSS